MSTPDVGELAVSFDSRSIKYGFSELDMLVPEEGHRHCSSQCLGAAAMVETGGMVAPYFVELELVMSPAVSSVPNSKRTLLLLTGGQATAM